MPDLLHLFIFGCILLFVYFIIIIISYVFRFFLAVPALVACGALAAMSGGSCLAAACGLPMAVAWVVVEHGFSCSLARGDLPGPGLNRLSLPYKVES